MEHLYHGLTAVQWLGLSLLPGLGASRLAHLWTYLESLHQQSDVHQATLFTELESPSSPTNTVDYQILRALGWPEQTARAALLHLNKSYLPAEAQRSLDQTFDWLARHDHHLIFRGDQHYPPLLNSISVPPTFLYVKGSCEAWDSPCIGIVGARAASGYGRKMAEHWGQQLSQQGLSVISGGARGIDTYAHQGAINARKPTVAVMGTGLLHLYPKQNMKLFEAILAQGGALISEYALATEVRPQLFPPRNRIISGMSHGVWVVEASEKSGSLISARYALEENRGVFALPGRVGDPQASGTNQLIRQGATLVTGIDDILAELPLVEASTLQLPASKPSMQEEQKPALDLSGLSTLACSLLSILREERVGMDFDALVRRSGFVAADLSQTLMELELSGVIANAQGQYQIVP